MYNLNNMEITQEQLDELKRQEVEADEAKPAPPWEDYVPEHVFLRESRAGLTKMLRALALSTLKETGGEVPEVKSLHSASPYVDFPGNLVVSPYLIKPETLPDLAIAAMCAVIKYEYEEECRG